MTDLKQTVRRRLDARLRDPLAAQIQQKLREADERQEVPDDAVSIDDPSEAPEDARTVTGPRGGLYYVPGDGDGGGDGDGVADLDASPEFSSDPPESVSIDDAVSETNLTEAGLPDGEKPDINIVEQPDGSEVFVKEQGIMDFVREQGFEGTVNDPLASTQMGSAVVRAAGGSTTANWADPETDTIRSEGIENVEGTVLDTEVDADALTDTVAAGMLAGNSDMHAAQFVVDDGGQPYLIDHDHSGRELDEGVLDGIQAVSGPLAATDVDFEDVWERAKEQVAETDVEGMAADLEAEGLDDHAEALRANAAFIEETPAEEVAQ